MEREDEDTENSETDSNKMKEIVGQQRKLKC